MHRFYFSFCKYIHSTIVFIRLFDSRITCWFYWCYYLVQLDLYDYLLKLSIYTVYVDDWMHGSTPQFQILDVCPTCPFCPAYMHSSHYTDRIQHSAPVRPSGYASTSICRCHAAKHNYRASWWLWRWQRQEHNLTEYSMWYIAENVVLYFVQVLAIFRIWKEGGERRGCGAWLLSCVINRAGICQVWTVCHGVLWDLIESLLVLDRTVSFLLVSIRVWSSSLLSDSQHHGQYRYKWL